MLHFESAERPVPTDFVQSLGYYHSSVEAILFINGFTKGPESEN